MASPYKQYYINGKDLFLIFGIYILRGSTDDFLRYPDKKDSIEHDWQDSNGLDVDLSRVFLKSKQIDLKCLLVTDFSDDFWRKYDRFLAELTTPGLKRFTVSEFERDFFIYYKACSTPKRYTRIKETDKIIYEFTLSVIEQEPKFNSNSVYLITEDNLFIVT